MEAQYGNVIVCQFDLAFMLAPERVMESKWRDPPRGAATESVSNYYVRHDIFGSSITSFCLLFYFIFFFSFSKKKKFVKWVTSLSFGKLNRTRLRETRHAFSSEHLL